MVSNVGEKATNCLVGEPEENNLYLKPNQFIFLNPGSVKVNLFSNFEPVQEITPPYITGEIEKEKSDLDFPEEK